MSNQLDGVSFEELVAEIITRLGDCLLYTSDAADE